MRCRSVYAIRGLVASLVAALPAHAAAPDALAGGFRIESEVREAGSEVPVAATVTLVCHSRAVDWAVDVPRSAAIFDFERDQVVLVDAERRKKAILPFTDLLTLAEQAAERARARPSLRFAAQPRFEAPVWDGATKQLRLHHPSWTYEAKLQPVADEALVGLYRSFADWSARLNTTLPGLPAGPRLALNQEIAAHGAVPREVFLRRSLEAGSSLELRSTHTYVWTLGEPERQRLAEIDAWVGECAPESLAEHRAATLQSLVPK